MEGTLQKRVLFALRLVWRWAWQSTVIVLGLFSILLAVRFIAPGVFDQLAYGGTLAGNPGRSCAWIAGSDGEIFTFNEPYGMEVEFDPVRLVDEQDGSTIAEAGDEVWFGEPTFVWQGRQPVCEIADARGHLRFGELLTVVE